LQKHPNLGVAEAVSSGEIGAASCSASQRYSTRR